MNNNKQFMTLDVLVTAFTGSISSYKWCSAVIKFGESFKNQNYKAAQTLSILPTGGNFVHSTKPKQHYLLNPSQHKQRGWRSQQKSGSLSTYIGTPASTEQHFRYSEAYIYTEQRNSPTTTIDWVRRQANWTSF